MANRYTEVHRWENLGGPGDARPTALQVVKDEDLVGGLKDKVVLVTGVNSGIGLETMKALAATGATVYGTVRDVGKNKTLLDSFPSSNVRLLELRLDSLSSVRAAAAELLRLAFGRLHILVANAGIMAAPEGRTEDGLETQLAVNHLGHFLLFLRLRDALLASATPEFPSRVVALSSSGHRIVDHIAFDNLNLAGGAYEPWAAYGQSKLANVFMASEIERRYGAAHHLHAWSVNPGGIETPLYKHLPAETMQAFDNADNAKYRKSPEQGAATTVWAAIAAELKGKGGRYLEDCGIVTAERGMDVSLAPGYAPWAYNPGAERRLWEESLRLVGEQD